MKHDQLCAIAHNLADSMASGLGFVIGYYSMDVFGEAAVSKERVIEVDFLNGHILRGGASESLRLAAIRFAEVLPAFCRENGADVADFRVLSATFDSTVFGRRVLVNVMDRSGKASVTEYAGVPLKRLRVLDQLGRIRRKPRLNQTNQS